MWKLYRVLPLVIGFCLLCEINVYARQENTVTLPESVYKDILDRLDTLQKRVDDLEQDRKHSEKKQERFNKDLDDIYSTLDEVETKSLKDRLNWGVEMRTRVDNYKVTDQYNIKTGQMDDFSADNRWTNRFRLNMAAEIMKGLNFHGRLTVYKNWSNIKRPSYYPYADPNTAHVPSDTSLKLDRAYVDWIVPRMPVPLVITFGRHPSSEGPPLEFKENRLRQSTYPALLFDGESDGIVATVGLERYLKFKNCGLRFAYGKGYQTVDDKTAYLDNRYGLDDLNIFGAFFETEIPLLPNSLFVLSYVRGDDFVDSPIEAGKNLGDMDLFGTHVQVPAIAETGLDFFFSWGLNRSHANNEYVTTSIGEANGQQVMMPMGLLTSDGSSDHTGWAIYTGLRYTTPIPFSTSPSWALSTIMEAATGSVLHRAAQNSITSLPQGAMSMTSIIYSP
jgi:hypothetical protein